MSNIVYSCILPHPPIIIPEVGKERLVEAEKTKSAMEAVAKKLKSKKPDVIIVITPHGDIGMAALHVYSSHVFEGDFANFGVPKPKFNFKGDSALAHDIVKAANAANINSAEIAQSWLDHGVLVPMYYPKKTGVTCPIVPIAIAFMPLQKLFDFGKSIAAAVNMTDKKTAIIASADMSHRLTADAPAGFNKSGKEFDEKLVLLVKKMDIPGILNFNPSLADDAGQDALWSISIMLGAIDGLNVSHEILSYEGPFGVGYMVAEFEIK